MELGIYTFGDMVPDPRTGRAPSPRQRVKDLMTMARLADDAGLDIMGIGEHHQLTFTVSATATVMAALAAVTSRIRLTSASTLLSTADPVRTFQEFATVDLVSGGRTELILGRGAFVDNFPLFGFDLKDYDALFAEKLELLLALNRSDRVTWSGKFRPPLRNAEIAPRPVQPQLPIWIGAGSPESLARAARHGLPVAIPMLGGKIPGYAALARFYRDAWADAGHDPAAARVATFSHMHIVRNSATARDDFYPAYSGYFRFLAPDRAPQGIPRAAFDHMAGPEGVLLFGSPQEVIDKLMAQYEAIGNQRYVGQIDVGGQPFARIAEAIELFGSEVAPVLRRETGSAGLVAGDPPPATEAIVESR